MPGLPDTFAAVVLDFITNRVTYAPVVTTLGSVTVAITSGVLTVSATETLAVGDAVQLGTVTGAAPLVAATTYYVASTPTTATLTLAATLGGAAIATTASGSATSIHSLSTYAYLALLNGDPGSNPTMTDIATLEITDSGYARQLVRVSDPGVPTLASPPYVNNSALFIYGPFTVGMSVGATYAVLVDAASGTTGTVRYIWVLDSVVEAAAGESVQFPADSLALGW
jgi:hypothetical protein